eukprot:XP_011426091.1 PREDICTED: uncharacterized protein LOC105327362 [Crassostrea gigas]
MHIWLKIFLTCVVSHKVQMKRHVVNTTCLELAKLSSQQFRLTCSQYNYHCLLDETLTKEFEVCREWKWIPKDTACYVKKNTSTTDQRTKTLHVTSTESSDGGISTFPKSETNDKQTTIWALSIAFVIVISVIIFAAVSYFGRLKCFQRLRKESQVVRKDDTDNKMPFLTIEIDENSSTMRSDNEHTVNRARRKVISNKKEEDTEESSDAFKDAFEVLPRTEQSTVISNKKEEDTEESSDVFKDAFEVLP